MTKNSQIVAEMRKIETANGGLLRAEDVVAAARPTSSPLHSWFTWDDSEAARNYRLWQARQLIRVTVSYLPENNNELTRVFVNLSTDRVKDGGGYRRLVPVMRNPEQRRQLLQDALAELEVFKRKYAMLTELADVFKAAERARRKVLCS